MATTNISTIRKWDNQRSRAAPELLTARELEAMLKIDVKTIYSYVQRGLIPYVKIQSNVRFPKEEILSWVEERSHRPRLAGGNGSIRP
jgi:excisionase family DNA binding protein